MDETALGTCSYSSAQKFYPVHTGADVGQGKGVDRKRDIVVLVNFVPPLAYK